MGAGVLTRALYGLSRVDPGFRSEGTYSAHVLLDPGRYREPESRRVYFRRLVEAVRAVPGVEAAALTTATPVPGMGIQIQVPYRGLDGPLVTEAGAPRAALRVVSPGYFPTIGIPLERGRDFEARDDEHAPDVAIVSESLAKSAFSGEDPLGKRLTVAAYGRVLDLEIVGVSADTRFAGLDEAPRPELFVPHAQMAFRGMAIVARTRLPPASIADQLKKTVLSLDSSQPLMSVDSLEASLARTLAFERFYSLLLGLFSVTSIVLAASGIYGVFAYWVSERRREMGLRIALGARPGDVVRIVVGRGTRITVVGLAIGLAASLVLSRALVGSFHGIEARDPLVLGLSLALLGLVAMAACYLPAREASHVDPMSALRSD